MNESSYNNVLNYRHKRDDEEPDSQESVWRRTDGVGKRMVSVGLVQFASFRTRTRRGFVFIKHIWLMFSAGPCGSNSGKWRTVTTLSAKSTLPSSYTRACPPPILSLCVRLDRRPSRKGTCHFVFIEISYQSSVRLMSTRRLSVKRFRCGAYIRWWCMADDRIEKADCSCC